MNTQINDGGPAFPKSDRNTGSDGMTLRDWFAGMALPGLVLSFDSSSVVVDVADIAYQYADAMLKARSAVTTQPQPRTPEPATKPQSPPDPK